MTPPLTPMKNLLLNFVLTAIAGLVVAVASYEYANYRRIEKQSAFKKEVALNSTAKQSVSKSESQPSVNQNHLSNKADGSFSVTVDYELPLKKIRLFLGENQGSAVNYVPNDVGKKVIQARFVDLSPGSTSPTDVAEVFHNKGCRFPSLWEYASAIDQVSWLNQSETPIHTILVDEWGVFRHVVYMKHPTRGPIFYEVGIYDWFDGRPMAVCE